MELHDARAPGSYDGIYVYTILGLLSSLVVGGHVEENVARFDFVLCVFAFLLFCFFHPFFGAVCA